MNRLPYVEATILELHRYKTLGPMALARCTSKDTEAGGYFIPKGTSVSLAYTCSGVLFDRCYDSVVGIMPNTVR